MNESNKVSESTEQQSFHDIFKEWLDFCHDTKKIVPTYEEDPEYWHRASRVIQWYSFGLDLDKKIPECEPFKSAKYNPLTIFSAEALKYLQDWKRYCETGDIERPSKDPWHALYPWDDFQQLMDEGRIYPIATSEVSDNLSSESVFKISYHPIKVL